MLQWFEFYIRGRSQKVVIGSTESKPQEIKSGIPQDSVLGPQLFILYFTPLEDIIKSSGLDCMMYAYDSQLYITINPDFRHSAIIDLEQCINDILSFFRENMLSNNASNNDLVHFQSRFSNHTAIPDINVGNHSVSTTVEARNLRGIFENNLTIVRLH